MKQKYKELLRKYSTQEHIKHLLVIIKERSDEHNINPPKDFGKYCKKLSKTTKDYIFNRGWYWGFEEALKMLKGIWE
jgi:hypothetical protein